MPAVPLPPINIPEMGPNAPVSTNERGAKQSHIPFRFDLEPPLAMTRIAEIQARGAENYGEWNWIHLDISDQINHAKAHLIAYVSGDTSEGHPSEHIAHAACRILYALELALREKIAVELKGTADAEEPSLGGP